MSEFNDELENFDNIMNNIENTMKEISFLENSKTWINNSKTYTKEALQTFYIKFLIFVIIANHFHILIDTNYSILNNVYNVIQEIDLEKSTESESEVDYNVIDYAEGIEIEDVD